MALIELPHTAGCVVCGRDNPHGLQLSLSVDSETGNVSTQFLTRPQHIGFEGIIHGGMLATVLDEAMVWAATWSGRRFCVCGELNTRFRRSAPVGAKLIVTAKVEAARSRLIETVGAVHDDAGVLYTTATGKYVPVTPEHNTRFVHTMLAEPQTSHALHALRAGLHADSNPPMHAAP